MHNSSLQKTVEVEDSFSKKLCKIWNKVTQLLAVGIVLYQFDFDLIDCQTQFYIGYQIDAGEAGLNSTKRFSYFSFIRGFSDQLHLRSETLKWVFLQVNK